jgi:hypothetical protein
VNDGFDVLAASNLSMIARAHDRRTAGHGKAVIYSVESNCYPLPALYGPPGEQLCDSVWAGTKPTQRPSEVGRSTLAVLAVLCRSALGLVLREAPPIHTQGLGPNCT